MTDNSFSAVGPAARCEVSTYHYPKPLRYVWHHILPQSCGGKTESGNLAQLCDTCHYAVHAMLWDLKVNSGALTKDPRNNKRRTAIAHQGYERAVAAGTTDKIPNEGSSPAPN